VFGGESEGSFYLDDLWFLDPGSLEMTAIDVPSGPVGRAGPTLIDDTFAGRLLLFGGQGEAGLMADTWQIGR